MNQIKITRTFCIVVSITTAFVFLYSCAIHFSSPYFFLSHLSQYGLVPRVIGPLAAAFIMNLNLTLAVCLALGLYRPGIYVASSCVLAVFACAQIATLILGLNIPCGCFGAKGGQIGVFSISIPVGLAVGMLVLSKIDFPGQEKI